MKTEHEIIQMLQSWQVFEKHLPNNSNKIVINMLCEILDIQENDISFEVEIYEQIKEKINNAR